MMTRGISAAELRQLKNQQARHRILSSGAPGPRHGMPKSPHLHSRPKLQENYKGSASLVCWRDYTEDLISTPKGALRGCPAPEHWGLKLMTPKALKAGIL